MTVADRLRYLRVIACICATLFMVAVAMAILTPRSRDIDAAHHVAA